MIRPTTDKEIIASYLSQWAKITNGYVQLTVYGYGYSEADVCYMPEGEHFYFEGSLDQILYDICVKVGFL